MRSRSGECMTGNEAERGSADNERVERGARLLVGHLHRLRLQRRRIAGDHISAEVRKLLRIVRRARVMGTRAEVLRGEAEGDGDVEIRECLHLPIEPGKSVW